MQLVLPRGGTANSPFLANYHTVPEERWCSRKSTSVASLLGKHWLKSPTSARHHSNHLHALFTTGVSSKEHGTNKPSPTRRIWERSKGDTSPYGLPTSQNPPHWNPSWLRNIRATRKDPESEWLARDNPETNPITIKPEILSDVAEQLSWFPNCCSLPRSPKPVKFLPLSVHVFPQFFSEC